MKVKSFEEALEKLEGIVKELENGNEPLDDAIKKYTEAMEKVKLCSEKLESATKTVNKILTENGTLEELEI